MDEVSNIGRTKISYCLKDKMIHKILNPEDFRVNLKYKIEDIAIKDKGSIYRENLAVLKGERTGALMDLVAVNVAVYMCFLEDFKAGYKESYNKAINYIASERVYKHFFNKI